MTLTPAGSTRAWRRMRACVLWRDGWTCRVPVDPTGRIDPAGTPCGRPADTVDHIVPRILGGTDDPTNLRAACWPHNRDKSGRLDADAAAPPPPRPRGHPARPAGRAWAWPNTR